MSLQSYIQCHVTCYIVQYTECFFPCACLVAVYMVTQKVVEDHERLLKEQADIERKYSINVKGFSVFHTVMEVRLVSFPS